jgi:hypothetical protein
VRHDAQHIPTSRSSHDATCVFDADQIRALFATRSLGAPKNTPTEIVEKLNKEINAALAELKMKAQIAELGGTVLPNSPADCTASAVAIPLL